MKYRTGIDARMLHSSGIGTYVRGLLEGLSSMNVPLGEFCLFGPETQSFSAFQNAPFNAKIYSVAEQFRYPGIVSQCGLWHSPHYNVPVLKGKTRLVTTVHDLIHWIFRKDFFTPLQAFYAGFMLRRAVTGSHRIITVSNHTKEDLVRCFDADPQKISVIHEGVSSQFRALHDPLKVQRVREKYGLPETFFLYVGNLKPHKNVQWLLRVFREGRDNKKIGSALVIVGKKDKAYRPEFNELAALQSGGGVYYLPSVDGEDLLSLYNAALALVHPSLYEGFGLTLLEAMACGLPVVACRAASIPEIAGEAAYLIEPGESEALLEAMQKMEADSALRHALILKGHHRASLFSWRQMAQKTFEVYQQVLNGN